MLATGAVVVGARSVVVVATAGALVVGVGPEVVDVEGAGGEFVVGEADVGDDALVSGPCSAMMPTKPTVVALRMVRGRFTVLSLDGVGLLVQRLGRDAAASREGGRVANEVLGPADEDVAAADVGD